MKCQGAGQPPKSLYKAIKHYRLRDGRPWHHNGQGECAHCGACHAVRPGKDNIARMVHHKDLSTCTPATRRQNMRRKSYWQHYYGMNRFQLSGEWQQLPTQATWGGPVQQVINVVETPNYVNSYNSISNQTWSSIQPAQSFRVELQSNTVNASGQYVFQLNGQTIVAPTARMTVAVDYASWNAWNNTITVSNNARLQFNQMWQNWTTGATPIYNLNVDAGAYQAERQRQNRRLAEINRAYTAPRLTQTEIEERRMREAEALFQRVEAERRAKTEAQQRAEQTLFSLLTPQQREEYRARKHFHIRGSKGTLYRILHGSSGNVRQVLSEADEGRGLHAFCAHPRMNVDARTAEDAGINAGHLPHEDAMIAQMLALMVDEDQFLAVANRHW